MAFPNLCFLIQALGLLHAHACNDFHSCHADQNKGALLLQLGKQSEQVSSSQVREAIAITTGVFETCQAQRALALAVSSQNEARDIYLLYDPDLQDDSSYALMSSLSGFLTAVPQPAIPDAEGFASFECSQRAGHSKASFLLWAAQNSESYRHFWHIEDDALMTGSWAPFFDHFAGDALDLIGNFVPAEQPVHNISCFLESGLPCVDVRPQRISYNVSLASLDPEPTREQYRTTGWSALRMSGRLAIGLVQSMALPGRMGHAEDITFSSCINLGWCSFNQIPLSFIGAWTLGGAFPTVCDVELQEEYPDAVPCTLEGLSTLALGGLQDGLFWHPVKCQVEKMGDNSIGIKALRMANATEVAKLMFNTA
mmetsp:Transcript_38979/g.70357  ORF Transcript_38979/g.70357 Transcript_38979/m.70357 type:complete len:368 (+) Transcript_38979:101-1204(+)